jgi:hypothetical protein
MIAQSINMIRVEKYTLHEQERAARVTVQLQERYAKQAHS